MIMVLIHIYNVFFLSFANVRNWQVDGQDDLGCFPKFLLAAMQLCLQRGARRSYSYSLVLKCRAPVEDRLHCLLGLKCGSPLEDRLHCFSVLKYRAPLEDMLHCLLVLKYGVSLEEMLHCLLVLKYGVSLEEMLHCLLVLKYGGDQWRTGSTVCWSWSNGASLEDKYAPLFAGPKVWGTTGGHAPLFAGPKVWGTTGGHAPLS